jgi:tetratricopeptide (TPR) repeat protein
LEELLPTVHDYANPPFILRSDLVHLDRVCRASAPEAVIFYCNRILESMANDAVRRLGQYPSANLFSNLQFLEHLNRIGTTTRYWAHGLRRLGNFVRHLMGPVTPQDAAVALVFVECWLEWFFCRFSHGPGLPGLTRDHQQLRLGSEDELRGLMRFLERQDLAPASAPSGPEEVQVRETLFRTPSLPAVQAEILLRQNRIEEARQTLQAGLARFPNDLRLRQLTGLTWSREDQLEKAIECLAPLAEEFPSDDETVGITAGVYKRRWQADRARLDDLTKAHHGYSQGWTASGRKNTYLGINAATTALWLGQAAEAARLAQDVERLLRERARKLPLDLTDPGQAFNYWDQVTLAEARLLQGDSAEAERAYQDAYAHARRASRAGDIESASDRRRISSRP